MKMDVVSDNLLSDWTYLRFLDNHNYGLLPVEGHEDLRELVICVRIFLFVVMLHSLILMAVLRLVPTAHHSSTITMTPRVLRRKTSGQCTPPFQVTPSTTQSFPLLMETDEPPWHTRTVEALWTRRFDGKI